MGTMKNIIDGNEAADAYARYMRKARRDGDKLPTRVHTDPEKRALARELNNELDKVHMGYRKQEQVYSETHCERCGKEVEKGDRVLMGTVYYNNGDRVNRYRHKEC